MTFEDAGEDHRHQMLRHVHLEARDDGGEGGAADLGGQFGEIGYATANGVQVHGQADFGGDLPERIPPRVP